MPSAKESAMADQPLMMIQNSQLLKRDRSNSSLRRDPLQNALAAVYTASASQVVNNAAAQVPKPKIIQLTRPSYFERFTDKELKLIPPSFALLEKWKQLKEQGQVKYCATSTD